MQISRAAFDLIVSEEVTSEAVYKQKYRRPEWPEGQSGVTVGIGYDLGQTDDEVIEADWKGRVSPQMLQYMISASGVTGTRAKALTAKLVDKINIPWETALAVHEQCVLPRWEAKTRRALPNFDKLHPDCKGALVSLTFNRGPSFSMDGPRYKEMRAIKTHMVAEDFDAIPAEFRAMRRLWTTKANTGVRKRRDTEAKLFEKGLAAMRSARPVGLMAVADDPAPAEVEDIVSNDSPAEVPASVQPSSPAPAAVLLDKDVVGDPEIFSVQKRLNAMNYYNGVVEGRWGGMLSGAIGGFVNDRMFHMGVPTSDEMFREVLPYLKEELTRAEAETPPWSRPVSDARANASPALVAEVAPEIVPVKQSYIAQKWAALVMFFTGLINAGRDYIAEAWSFYSGHKDDLPSPDSSMLSSAMEWLGKVPMLVWFALATAAIGAVALRTRQGVQIAENAVKTGAR